jgi:TDG/mug DNA glycosylase family protein
MNSSDYPTASDKSAGLEPVAGLNTQVLILGSFPSRLSLQHTEYYGNTKNHFWEVMEALFGIDAGLPYAKRIEQVRAHRIALWDVVRSCSRPGSADANITNPVFNDIPGFATTHPMLRLVALNGSTAGRFYSQIAADIMVPSIVLPSTSPANAQLTLAEKIKRWSVIQKHRIKT